MHTSISKTCVLAALAAALMAAQAASAQSASSTPDDTQMAYVTGKKGFDAVLGAACGEIGEVAKAERETKNFAKVTKGWHADEYKNENDPITNTRYGKHVTVETYKKNKMTGRWHLYESGAAWVDRKGNIAHSCNG